MLHESKRKSILEWFNSLVDSNIQSFTEFRDANGFLDIIRSLCCSSSALLHNSYLDTLTDGKIPQQIDEKYAVLKKFIDDVYHIDSSLMIDYEECKSGKELELAKVAVFLLSALVQSLLSAGSEEVNTLTLLTDQTQEDIKECLALLVENSPHGIRRAELHRILNRPAKCKGSSRFSSGRSSRTPQNDRPLSSTPRNSRSPRSTSRDSRVYGKVNLRQEITPINKTTQFAERSPLKDLLESPVVQNQAVIFCKDREIHNLRYSLHLEENKVAELRSEKEELKTTLSAKDKELMKIKEEYRKLRDILDEGTSLNNVPCAEPPQQTEEEVQRIKNELKEEIRMLKKECEDMASKNAELEQKAFLQRATREALAVQTRMLHELQRKLAQSEISNEAAKEKLRELEHQIRDLKEKCIFYENGWEEAFSAVKLNSSLLSDSSRESNISSPGNSQDNEAMVVDGQEPVAGSSNGTADLNANVTEIEKVKRVNRNLRDMLKHVMKCLKAYRQMGSRAAQNVAALQSKLSNEMSKSGEQFEDSQEKNSKECEKCNNSIEKEAISMKKHDAPENLGQLWAPYDDNMDKHPEVSSENETALEDKNPSPSDCIFNAVKDLIFYMLKIVTDELDLKNKKIDSCLLQADSEDKLKNNSSNKSLQNSTHSIAAETFDSVPSTSKINKSFSDISDENLKMEVACEGNSYLPSTDSETKVKSSSSKIGLQNVKNSLVEIFHSVLSTAKVNEISADVCGEKQKMEISSEENSCSSNYNMSTFVDLVGEIKRIVLDNANLELSVSELEKDFRSELDKKDAMLLSVKKRYEKLRTEVKQQFFQLETDYKSQLDEKDAELCRIKEQYEKLNSELEQQLQELEKDYKAQLDKKDADILNIKQQYEKLNVELNQQLFSLGKNYTSKLDKKDAELQRFKQQYEKLENVKLKQQLFELDEDYKFQLDKKDAELLSIKEKYENLEHLYMKMLPTNSSLVMKCEELNGKLKEALSKAKMATVYQAQKEKLQHKYSLVKTLLVKSDNEKEEIFKKCQEKLNKYQQNLKMLHTALEKEKQKVIHMSVIAEGLKTTVASLESKKKILEIELQTAKIVNENLGDHTDAKNVFHKDIDNTTLNENFDKAITSSDNVKLQKDKSNMNTLGPSQKLISVKTIVHEKKYANESSTSGAIFNKSLHGSVYLYADDEEEFLNHSNIAEIHRKTCEESGISDVTDKRMEELQRRNTLCPPHLQSVYPVELQAATPVKSETFFGELQKPQKVKDISVKRKLDSSVPCAGPEQHLLKKNKFSHWGGRNKVSTPLQKIKHSVKKPNIHHFLYLKKAK